MKKVLAIDMGATSVRGILGYMEDGLLKQKEVMRFSHEIKEKDGRLYWDFYGILDKIVAAIKENPDIASLAIDSWGVDFALIDKEGELIDTPLCYRDPGHGEGYKEAVKKLAPEEIFALTGNELMSINTLFQLLAYKKFSPDKYDKADKLLMMPDLIAYLLTGEKIGEETILSTSQMLNLSKGDYSYELLKQLDIDKNILPERIKAGNIIGNTKNSKIKELREFDINVVAVCGHDTASAVLLTEAMRDEECMFLSCGTWSLFGVRNDKPLLSERAYKKGLTNEAGFDSAALLFKNITGLYLFEKYKSGLEKKWGREISFDEINEFVKKDIKLRSEVNNLIDMSDERFAVEEFDAGFLIDAYLKEKGKKLPEEDMEYFRIIYESMAAKYAEVKKDIEELTGKNYKRLHIIGGGAKSPVLREIIGKRLGLEIKAGPFEASALGSIIIQLAVLKEIESVKKGVELVLNLL